MSAAAAALGGSLTTPSQVNAALSSALAESAGSIGLRTQSIQLMRDALYRVCELYYSKALNDTQVMLLHQKYQDVMIAVLAIEQLSGAVVPKALGLNTGSKGDALARSKNLGEAVRDARAKVAAAEAELVTASEKAESAKVARDTEKQKNDAAQQNAALTPAQKMEAKNAYEASEKSLVQAEKDKKAAQQALEDEKTRLSNYINAEDAAFAQVKSEASGTSVLEGGSIATTIDKDTAEHIASAVKDIVKNVVDKNYTAHSCMGLLADIDDVTALLRRKERLELQVANLKASPQSMKTQKEQERLDNKIDTLEWELRVAKKELNVVDTCLKVIVHGLQEKPGTKS